MSYLGLGFGADIQVAYDDVGNNNSLGSTSLVTYLNQPCGINVNEPDTGIISASVTLDIRPDWFTQADHRRYDWEHCYPSYIPVYTCSKTRDAGATLAHELGHALGLADVHAVDDRYNNFAATQAAFCLIPAQQATMCSPGTAYSSARRTLDQYDSISLLFHYWNARDFF
jgi:hypothetical protein